jgi:phage baseplate assembly protein W
MEFKFKSAGRDIVDVLSDNAKLIKDIKAIPIGIMTPLRNSRTGHGIFEVHYNLTDQVTDNLRNLIQTNYGERLGRPDYGANLRPLSLELLGQENFESEAMTRISKAVGKYLPFVNLKSMSVTRIQDTESEMPQVVIRIVYDVSRLGKNKAMDVIVNLAG